MNLNAVEAFTAWGITMTHSKNLNRRYCRLALVGAVATALLACSAPSNAEEYSIGLCQSTATGPAKFATALWKGAEIAVNGFNALSDGNGPTLKVVAMDIANNDPAQARLSMKKSIQLDGIKSLLCWGTNVMVQSAPLVDENKILAFTMSQGTGVVAKSRYIQQLEGVTTLQCRSAAQFAKTAYPYIKRLAVLYVNYEYGRELLSKCDEEFGKVGVELVASEAHPKSPPDLRAQLTKILAEEPDAIYLGAIGGGTVALAIRTGRELGYDGVFMTHGAGDTPDVYGLKLAEEKFFYVSHGLPADAPEDVRYAVDQYGGYVGAGYDFAWLSGYLIKRVADRGDEVTGEAITRELRSLGTLETPINSFRFLEDGNTIRGLAVFSIKDGKRSLLQTLSAEDLQ